MAQTLVCDMSDLPPEVLAQIMQEEAAEAAANTPEQAAAHTPEQAARDASNIPEQAASQSAGKSKRNALKRRQRAAAPEDELVSMNVRLSRDAYDAVQALADEYGVSKAMVIRTALSGHMGDHFASMRFSDDSQAASIRADIRQVNASTNEIGHQLRRLGKNYNEALKLAHAAAKRGSGQAPVPEMDPDLINRMIDRYNVITERLGDMLWRILK